MKTVWSVRSVEKTSIDEKTKEEVLEFVVKHGFTRDYALEYPQDSCK
jgi:hypothetical protein